MPPVFMRRQGGHLSVAADARSSGRSVSGAFLQAVGVHAPHDRPTRPRPETESHSKIGVSVIMKFTLAWHGGVLYNSVPIANFRSSGGNAQGRTR